MNNEFKINPRIQELLFWAAILLLPSLGGIKELITNSFGDLGFEHIICLVLWLTYAVYFYKSITMFISMQEDNINFKGLIISKSHNFQGINQIEELSMPKRDFFKAALFDPYVTFLYIKSSSGRSLARISQINNYKELKTIVEERIGRKLERNIKKKTFLYWILDSRF